MISFSHISHALYNERSAADKRVKCDVHFIVFNCPADSVNSEPHNWVCRFEVSKGATCSNVKKSYDTKKQALADGVLKP